MHKSVVLEDVAVVECGQIVYADLSSLKKIKISQYLCEKNRNLRDNYSAITREMKIFNLPYDKMVLNSSEGTIHILR